MTLGHHGYGEELLLYAVGGGGTAVPVLLLFWRERVARLAAWLRRR